MSATAVAALVHYTYYQLPYGEWVSPALSFFAWTLIVVSSIVFSVIMVPLYLQATDDSSETSSAPRAGRGRTLRKTRVLGCGTNHESALLADESSAPADPSPDAAPSSDGVVIDIRRAMQEKEQLP